MTVGNCSLTGANGKFVDSHLIPRALTKHHTPGRPFVQTRGAQRPIRRRTSWYDPLLVTQSGEDILSGYDNWAIGQLRHNRLVWSSWGLRRRLAAADHAQVDGTPYGIRHLTGIDKAKLRLFFLSLLWRAAASSLPEFEEVSLHGDELEQLRTLVLEGDPGPLDFFPISLTQLSTRGPAHNHAPIAQDKFIPAYGDAPSSSVPIFRFYFDGLIAHFVRDAALGFTESNMGQQAVGYSDEFLVSTVSYEASFQHENLRELTLEAEDRWPEEMDRLYRAARPEAK